MKKIQFASLLLAFIFLTTVVFALPPGEGPALGERITQNMIVNDLSLKQIRKEGLRIFSTPFNLFDGLGDGPINPLDTVSPGGRPGGIQTPDTPFLRMNGLDSQTCLECHGIRSNAKIPAEFAVGGFGAFSDSAFPGVIDPDIDDTNGYGYSDTKGRIINPPFSYGSGGVELVGKEMTADLQALKAMAEANPDTDVELVTKGVSFGSISFDGSVFNTTNVVGIEDDDLVVRPFGRKGCCATIREFDTGALQFHHGMQPVEVVGEDVDADGDGVTNEILIGELSAMHIFQVMLEKPWQRGKSHKTKHGAKIFEDIGCAECHIPELHTESKFLPLSFPEVPMDPSANVYMEIDLNKRGFKKKGTGVRVKLYSDLKRHDMGLGLAESTGDPLDPFFITPRLWGVADTGPWLHDGRAVTLTDAILMHGGEGEASRDGFDALSDSGQKDVLAFLRTLRTPKNPSRDLLKGDNDD